MDRQTPLLEMLHQIENEIARIRTQLDPPRVSLVDKFARLHWAAAATVRHLRRLGRGIRRAYNWINANWGFLAFLFAVLVTIWVYLQYGVGYFEAQKTLSLTKKASESYRVLGDKLILYGEFKAATEAYNSAIRIDQSNLEARRGLLKTDVLEPLPGQRLIIPEVEETKIKHLRDILEQNEEGRIRSFFNRIASFFNQKQDTQDETYIVSYLLGERYERQRNYPCAKKFYKESIDKNQDFIYGYICLGFANILAGDPIDSPITPLTNALSHQKSALALNNLGYCYLLQIDFKTATEKFQESLTISPHLETYVNLGDAYRYQGYPDKALYYHNLARDLLTAQNEREYAVAGRLAINFMPKYEKDWDTPRTYVAFGDTDHKRMLVYYELSFDYAMKGDLGKADEMFKQASALDEDKSYQPFVKNKIEFIEHPSKAPISETSKKWFRKTRLGLRDAPSPPPIQPNTLLKCE